MKIERLFVIIFACTCSILGAQYNPELDLRGVDDGSDGGELQLATPSNNHWLRLFSGHNSDPNPFLYFSEGDLFRIGSGETDFSGFNTWMAIRGTGEIGIHTDLPQSELHINGELTMPWGARISHYNSSFGAGFQHLPWLNKAWSSSLLDFTYIGGSGNRDSNVQPAVILSQGQVFLFGKGSNTADVLSAEHAGLTSDGDLGINTSSPSEKLDVDGSTRIFDLAG